MSGKTLTGFTMTWWACYIRNTFVPQARQTRTRHEAIHTLIESAKVASLMRRGEEFGLPQVIPRVDLSRVSKLKPRGGIESFAPHQRHARDLPRPERAADEGVVVSQFAARCRGARSCAPTVDRR